MISLNHNALFVNFLQGSVLLGATATFLPSFLLAIISTLDLTNKKSLSILISHPYLVLLPTFTMFSYSKLKICGDRRIALSSKLSIVNMLFNAVVFPGIFIVLLTIRMGLDVSFSLNLLLFPLAALLFTLLFLYIEKIFCCPCCGSAGRLVRVFDPEEPEKTFIMEGGRVVELTESDVEQGGYTNMRGLEGETEAKRDSDEADEDQPELETENSKKEEGEADSVENTPDISGQTQEEEEEKIDVENK